MKAFDTDVLTEILLGDPTYVARAATIPPHEQAVPVIVIEELLRGRLHVIRQAEAGQAKVDLARAYALFEQTLRDVRQVTVLSYTPQAEALYQHWRQQRLRPRPMIFALPRFAWPMPPRSSRAIGRTLSRCLGCRSSFGTEPLAQSQHRVSSSRPPLACSGCCPGSKTRCPRVTALRYLPMWRTRFTARKCPVSDWFVLRTPAFGRYGAAHAHHNTRRKDGTPAPAAQRLPHSVICCGH